MCMYDKLQFVLQIICFTDAALHPALVIIFVLTKVSFFACVQLYKWLVCKDQCTCKLFWLFHPTTRHMYTYIYIHFYCQIICGHWNSQDTDNYWPNDSWPCFFWSLGLYQKSQKCHEAIVYLGWSKTFSANTRVFQWRPECLVQWEGEQS